MASTRHGFPNLSLACAAMAAIVLSGCGGGGAADTDSAPPFQGTINGNVVKGPVSGATVSAHRVSDGAMGPAIASATTDANGGFALSVGNYAGPVMLRVSRGTYIDEATALPMNMASGDVMTAVIAHMAQGSAVSGVQVTPLTSMAQAMASCMPGGLTSDNITTANGEIGTFFMVHDIVHTPPMNPLVAGSGAAASQDMMNYGMTLAAMSQYARNMGMQISSPVVTSMMSDVCDGTMDGLDAGRPIPMGGHMMDAGMTHPDSGTAGVAGAMHDFASSHVNVSGVTLSHMATLMDKLSSSDGHVHPH